MTKSLNITEKMVLGTAQFGMDYGIANASGKPSKKEVFGILDLAWEKGVTRFDTAPDYGSEKVLGDFITDRGLQNEAKVLTKIPSLEESSDYHKLIRLNLETSLIQLGCPIDVLFFHNSADSLLLMKDPDFFEKLLYEYPISSLGVSVYEPHEVERLSACPFELAFQFPFNVLDRRFEQMSMPRRMRYARSIFLQGVLASENGMRIDAPTELLNLQKEYHDRLAKHNLDPVKFSVSFASSNDTIDYFLFGVDTEKQLKDILDLEPYGPNDMSISDTLLEIIPEKWLDPRQWHRTVK